METIEIIAKLLEVAIPSIVTLIASYQNKKRSNMHNAKQSIFQLILEDKYRVSEGKPPENYQAIMHEFDDYSGNGGNSYVHERVDEYIKWYNEIKIGGKL